MLKQQKFFDLPAGGHATLYSLRNADGFGVDITDFGASVTGVFVPDRSGMIRNVALSWGDPLDYITNSCYFGAAVGRLANRVGGGTFSLDGKTYRMALNDRNASMLHGGIGISRRLWTLENCSDSELLLSLDSPDGDGGFPGHLKITFFLRISPEHRVEMEFRAATDRKTVADFTNHTYFNLNGADSGICSGHEVMIAASGRTEVDENLIPTGAVKTLAGDAFDLRKFRSFEDIWQDIPGGFDDNFILNDRPGVWVEKAAVVRAEKSGIRLTVDTDRPGIQFYMGGGLNGECGPCGAYRPGSGFCLETQSWPDSVNHPEFPSVVITPEQGYHSTTVWSFDIF